MAFDLSSNSIEILSERESIRSELVDYAKTYLELENVDLYKTSFLSYVINVMSMLAANQLYYTSSIYREFFITEAQMIESVYNLAKWIGYTPANATPATTDIMFILPFAFKDNDVQFIIPDNFQVKSDDIIYTIGTQDSITDITIKVDSSELSQLIQDQRDEGVVVRAYQNKSLTVRNNSTGYFYPVAINTEDETASVLLPFTQYTTTIASRPVPDDLELYQFWSMEVDFEGMDWKVDVFRESESGIYSFEDDIRQYDKLEQAENNSLYTMTGSEEKYVWISTLNKGELFFGNGIIGKQPPAGKNLIVIVYVTKGLDGRVIANSLTTPDRLYYQGVDDNNQLKNWLVKLSTTNPSAAVGGSDAPTISEIKSGAIANLRSKQRLVSDTDYDDFEDIITNTPLSDVKPILKRSDLKINEIEVFSKLLYNEDIVPTRNVAITDSTSLLEIADGTVYNIDGENFQTIFTMSLDYFTGEATYEYVVRNISVTAVQEATTDYAQYCYIILSAVNFKRVGDTIEISAGVTNIEDKIATDSFDCEITTGWNGFKDDMISVFDTEPVPNLIAFADTLPNYLEIPTGKHKITFDIYGEVADENLPESEQTGNPLHTVRKLISTYSLFITIRKDLSSMMRSSIFDHPPVKIHNVPMVLSQYMSELDDPAVFEASVIQAFVNNIEMQDKKMLTDFPNIKFCNTTGRLSNMKLNAPNLSSVETQSRTTVPISPTEGYRFIVSGLEASTWVQYKNQIAEWNGTTYDYSTPSINDMILVNDESKKYVWTGSQWFYPEFGIPFEIEASVYRSDELVNTSLVALVENIKAALVEYFTPLFGLDKNIDRSEIIKVIREVPGVNYANLLKPEIDIRFTYRIKDLDQDTLLDYTPELVVFTNNNITIHVVE